MFIKLTYSVIKILKLINFVDNENEYHQNLEEQLKIHEAELKNKSTNIMSMVVK